LIPSGVISNAHDKISATGKPRTSNKTTRRTAQLGMSKNGKTCVATLNEQPSHDCVGDGNLVNVAPLQLGKESRRVHSAHLDQVLVRAALYPGARDLKSRVQRSKQLVKRISKIF